MRMILIYFVVDCFFFTAFVFTSADEGNDLTLTAVRHFLIVAVVLCVCLFCCYCFVRRFFML